MCGNPILRVTRLLPGEPGYVILPGDQKVSVPTAPDLCEPCYSEFLKNWKPTKRPPPPPEEREDRFIH
jgi:hypothetical protein